MNREAERLGADEDGRGRIDAPPDPRALARLPEDFGKRFLVFVDTEEEFDWTRPLARENRAVTAIARLPEAHRFFAAAGVACAYMVDYPVVNDARAADILRGFLAEGACEIGAQLHPWVTPPHEEEVSSFNSFTGNLPVALQRAKLDALTERIEAATGVRPIAYRAGRYGIGAHSAALLEAAGYRLDASVRALFDYSAEGGPDFSRFGVYPFWAGPGGTLLDLPLSAAYVGALRRRGGALYRFGNRFPLWRGLLARTGLLRRVALTPEDYPLAEAIETIHVMLGEGVAIFSLSYHSPSVEPGHTPYVRDAADLRAFYAWWDGVLALFAREGVAPARVSELVAAADAAR